MKKIVFIGNRINILRHILASNKEFEVIKIFALRNSMLESFVKDLKINCTEIFTTSMKSEVINYLKTADFDILISNGNPFILPMSQIQSNQKLFINIHPTYLPFLKGKTPLNAPILLGFKYLGATMHYMDDGIDTGPIIYRKKVRMTKDIDQGLIYHISFDLELEVFATGIQLLKESNYNYSGRKYSQIGSYFNREDRLFQLDFELDDKNTIMRKINSLGVKSQGNIHVFRDKKIKLFHAEAIQNLYLLDKFSYNVPGEIVLEYDEYFLIKTKDGILKCRGICLE